MPTKKATKRASLFKMMRRVGNFGVPVRVKPRPENSLHFYIMAEVGTNRIRVGTGEDYKKRLQDHKKGSHTRLDMVVLGVMHASKADEDKIKAYWRPQSTKKPPPGTKYHGWKNNEWFNTNAEMREYIKEWMQQPYVATGTTTEEIDRKLHKYPHIANGECWLPPRKRDKTIGFFKDVNPEHDGTWSDFLDKVGEDSYYSPDLYTSGAREVMGGIDLDPASCKLANWGDGGAHKGVRAKKFFDITQDGLKQEWSGRVFINPPFGEWQHWSRKCERELFSGRVTQLCIFLGTTTITNTGFARLKKIAQAVYIPDGRKHGNTWGPKSIQTSAYQGHCLFYWGPNAERFKEVFSDHGSVFLGGSDEAWKREAERRGLRKRRVKRVDNEVHQGV